MRKTTVLLGVLSSLLLIFLPTVSDAVTITCGTTTRAGTGFVDFSSGMDCGNGFTATGRVDAIDSPTNSLIVLSGNITNGNALPGQLTVSFASTAGDFATKPIDTYQFNLSASGFFSDANGGTNATGDSFTITGNAANATPTGPLVFVGTSTANQFDRSATASGACGFGGEVEGSPCSPSLSVISMFTIAAGGSVDMPISLEQQSRVVPEPTTVALLIPGIAGLALFLRARRTND